MIVSVAILGIVRKFLSPSSIRWLPLCLTGLLAGVAVPDAFPQGPMPEEGATLFPSGAFVSYSSIFTSGRLEKGAGADAPGATTHPTFQHRVPLTLSWSFRRDLQFSSEFSIVTKRADLPGDELGGTGLGDTLITLKYRFLRLDSERGTTQLAATIGPKLPTGTAGLRDSGGSLFPVQLQPGSGSTDLFAKVNGTHTGLFNLRRLVLDGSFSYLARTEGSRRVRLGNEAETRFWLHYRPYQARLVGPEWFIGPSVTWRRRGHDRQRGIRQPFTGGEEVAAGFTTYVSPVGGLVFWFGLEFPVYHDSRGAAHEPARRMNIGVTKQFVLRP